MLFILWLLARRCLRGPDPRARPDLAAVGTSSLELFHILNVGRLCVQMQMGLCVAITPLDQEGSIECLPLPSLSHSSA